MRTIRNPILLLFTAVLFFATVPFTKAQNQYNSTSAYSSLGAGFPIDVRSSYASSMGITGVSLRSRTTGSLANPALWSNTFFTLANGGVGFNTYQSEDDFGQVKNTYLAINQFQLQLPVIREELGVSISLFPETESRFSALNSYSRDPQFVGGDTLRYESRFRGEGGLNRLELGAGYKLNEYLSVGYAASLVFGQQRFANDVLFATPGHTPVSYDTRVFSLGFGNRFGLYAELPNPFADNDAFTFGLMVSLPVSLTSELERTVTLGNTVLSEDITVASETGELRLPMELTAGLTYYINRIVLVTGEIQTQNWTDYRNFTGNTENYLQNRVKFGAGMEYAAFNRPEVNLFTRFNYRAGVSFDRGHLVLMDKGIETVMFSAGLGIPSPATGSSVNINFDYGIRGTTSHELVRERIFAVRMSFNLSEPMFFRRRLQ
jgi:hypothetical protein